MENKYKFDGQPEEKGGSTSLLAKLILRRTISHFQAQNLGKAAPGVVSWVESDDAWRGYALAIPELDVSQLRQKGLVLPFYSIDRDKKQLIEPTRYIQAKLIGQDGYVPERQVQDVLETFNRDDLVLIHAMLGKAALLGTPKHQIEPIVDLTLKNEYLDQLAELFGNESDHSEPENEPYEDLKFVAAAKERLNEDADFLNGPADICLARNFKDGEVYFIQLSSLCGELEELTLMKRSLNRKLVSDAFSYQDPGSDYSGFWNLEKLVEVVQAGEQISTDQFNDFFENSELISDVEG